MHIIYFFSFYQRKYKVFLQLFAHQREYQALMNDGWWSQWDGGRANTKKTLWRKTENGSTHRKQEQFPTFVFNELK